MAGVVVLAGRLFEGGPAVRASDKAAALHLLKHTMLGHIYSSLTGYQCFGADQTAFAHVLVSTVIVYFLRPILTEH